MGTKVIAVLCEGPHDVAFLTKLLKLTGLKVCEGTKLKDFPSPMDQILTTEATKANVEELKLSEINYALLPSGVLKNEEDSSFFFLYALGGDSRKDKRNRILSTLMDSVPQKGEVTELISDTKICIAYFLDSDDKGVEKRLNEITQEIRIVLDSGEISITENGQITTFNGLQIGGYVFRKDEDRGKLEDILLPLMQTDNEKIFEDAKNYIETHYEVKRVKKKKNFNEDKAIIGIAGQLQKSGTSNNVIISQTDYITLDKVNEDTKCQEIISFFQLLSK